MTEISHLPALEIVPEVNRSIRENAAVVITAPPGAGKSTLLPLAILESLPSGKTIMLEPRRIAARQIASRMASLLGEEVGDSVGYRIRFEKRVSRKSRVEVVTEGILTRMLVEDPSLEGVAAVIFDEFHERSLQTDLALALCREVQEVLRPDLKLVLMSATLDSGELGAALGAPVISCGGKLFPVEMRYSGNATPDNVVDEVTRAVLTAHRECGGDILVFLPGEAEIRRCADMLEGRLGMTRLCPLYGMLSIEEQRRAIAPSAPGERKVVLATPIAETSLTIEGVRVVVDSGLFRKPVFDARTSLEHLETLRISRDMAVQRAGRAGRVAPGTCFRLWSMGEEERMKAMRVPEILEADLSPVLLQIAAWGESRPERLPWLVMPPEQAVKAAKKLLVSLGATDEDGRISARGLEMAALPCHPRVARMMLMAGNDSEKALAADIAALLEEKDPLSDVADAGIDLRIKALRDARAVRRCGQWSRISRIAEQYRRMTGVDEDNGPFSAYDAGALIAAAYPERIARVWKEGDGRYVLSGGDLVAVGGESALSASEWLAVASVHTRSGGVGRVFLAAPVDPGDLKQFARERDNISWDSKSGCVVARKEWRIGVHLLEWKAVPDCSRETMLSVVAGAARKEGLSMFDFSGDCENLQRRVAAVAEWHPELDLPDLSTSAVLEKTDVWLPLYAGKELNVSRLRKIDMCAVIWGMLTYEQQTAVERFAPSQVTVPTGSRIHLEYRSGAEAPVLRVRLQECFGLVDTPAVDEGRRPVLMELLSPGFKPVQLTRDLRSFWSGTYHEVRKELRRRYPKHSWPDDPLSADPVRGVKRPHKP
ncbi:MAG: ATP-dependent helicase HrpB [Bacteroidales bacterium]|nr:ATP-dependent helicase HrpB [Bacteroidales bacterium]